jgi:hypothetical protein
LQAGDAGNVRRYGPFRTRYHPWPIPILAEARGLMPLSETCLRIAIGAFVVGSAPFSLAIFYRYLDDISASDIALIIAMATVVVAVVSLFVGIIAKVRETPPS